MKRLAAILLCLTFVAAGIAPASAEPPPRPPEAAPSLELPPLIPDDVPMAQIFMHRIKDPSVLVGTRILVWGALQADLSGPYTSYYYPNDRDFDREHDVRWFEENHPEWVTYECDQRTPAYGFTYPWGAYIPLDFTREDVRRYVLETYLLPAIRRGYPAIALDNASVANWKKVCGVYRNGTWVQQFSGERRDPTYFAALHDYISWLRKELHRHGAVVMLNVGVDVRRPDVTRKLIALADVWLDEPGYANDCRRWSVDEAWRIKTEIVSAYAAHKGYIQINKTCQPFAALDQAELNWILANFLLVRGPRSYLAIMGLHEAGQFLERPDLRPAVGEPLGGYRSVDALYTREYQKAVVAVNPSSTEKATVRLPAAGFRNLAGEILPESVTLAPRSGLVALRPPR